MASGEIWAVASKLAWLDAGAVASLGWQAECGRERKSSDFLLHTKLLVVKFSLLENNLRCVLYGDFAR